MEIAGLIVSLIALSLAIFTYFKHDLKIKKQDTLLKSYQIEKINQEREQAKKAIIEANVIKHNKGKRIVKIYNKGKSLAKNVNVYIPKNNGYEILKNPSPIDIKSLNSAEIILIAFTNSPDKIKIEFEWSDDYMDLNKDSQTIQI